MWTETFGQLIDRIIVSELKMEKFAEAKNETAYELAAEQAQRLSTAIEVCLLEIVQGTRKAEVQQILRFHNHHKTEGAWAGKSVQKPNPQSIGEAISLLVQTHCQYWQKQSRIQGLKEYMRRDSNEPILMAEHQKDFVETQRQLDLLNQDRNVLVEQIDKFLVGIVEKSKEKKDWKKLPPLFLSAQQESEMPIINFFGQEGNMALDFEKTQAQLQGGLCPSCNQPTDHDVCFNEKCARCGKLE